MSAAVSEGVGVSVCDALMPAALRHAWMATLSGSHSAPSSIDTPSGRTKHRCSGTTTCTRQRQEERE